jgi:hypothetical protein
MSCQHNYTRQIRHTQLVLVDHLLLRSLLYAEALLLIVFASAACANAL